MTRASSSKNYNFLALEAKKKNWKFQLQFLLRSFLRFALKLKKKNGSERRVGPSEKRGAKQFVREWNEQNDGEERSRIQIKCRRQRSSCSWSGTNKTTESNWKFKLQFLLRSFIHKFARKASFFFFFCSESLLVLSLYICLYIKKK